MKDVKEDWKKVCNVPVLNKDSHFETNTSAAFGYIFQSHVAI